MRDSSGGLSGLIGASLPRTAISRLVRGQGRYTDDIAVPGMLHAAFFRSPYAHARVLKLDVSAARQCPGIVAVYTAADIATVCDGWRGVLARFASLRSPVQTPLAGDCVFYQGEPVAIVVAESRAEAEDALEHIVADWQELPAVISFADALKPDATVIHEEIGSNIAFEQEMGSAQALATIAAAEVVVEQTLHSGRQTGVTLEARSIVAIFEPKTETLTVYQSHQVPHQMQAHYADLLRLPMGRVRVICPDVGGAFGMKLHVYPDEVAVCAASRLLGRAVKYVADRLESFTSDAHAREHVITGRLALTRDGRMIGFAVDDLHGMGAYSIFPRGGPAEAMGATRMVGSPYRFEVFHGRVRCVFQNKTPAGQYRGVGHPVATALTELLVDQAARRLGVDRIELRRRNFVPCSSERWKSPADVVLFDMSHQACLDKLVAMMDYEALAESCAAMRKKGRLQGIGIASYVELTATGPEVYGRGQVPVSAIDSVSLRVDPSGEIVCHASVTDQGQGTATGVQQIIADRLGVPLSAVTVYTGDTASVPGGGGAWASRGAAIGGEAAYKAAERLRANILSMAAELLQLPSSALKLEAGAIVEIASGQPRMSLRQLAEIAYYRPHELPPDCHIELALTHQYRRTRDNFLPTNGVQAAHVEIDPGTGFVKLLSHWVVEDCGRVINPLLVDEQIRGGVVQGIGHALYECCRYSSEGQLTSATMADYLVPMAVEMPDIRISHVETPYAGSQLGAKGAGEAGTCAAAAAVLNAVNDALADYGRTVTSLPIMPEELLEIIHCSNDEKVPA
jgi:carbon-monoxide dehydrogenase large subunit